MKKAKNKLNSNLEEVYKNSVIRKCRIEENIDSMRLDKYLGNRLPAWHSGGEKCAS